MVAACLTLAAWFAAADLFAAWAGGMKLRPVAAVLLALVWPLSVVAYGSIGLCAHSPGAGNVQ